MEVPQEHWERVAESWKMCLDLSGKRLNAEGGAWLLFFPQDRSRSQINESLLILTGEVNFHLWAQGARRDPKPSLFSVPSGQPMCLILCVSPVSDPGQGEVMPTRAAVVESERSGRGSQKPGVVSKH